jgi:uncharacterized membrane protein YfcA
MGLDYLAQLLLAGVALGLLNTVSSSGSAVSLPLLLALGFPASIANATNRVPVMAGLAMALWHFHRADAIPWRLSLKLLPGMLLGTLIGTGLSLLASMMELVGAIQFALIAALVLLLIKPQRWLSRTGVDLDTVKVDWRLQLVFIAIGIWAGFIVLDTSTYILLSLVLLSGVSLVQANGVKIVLMGTASLLSVILFVADGQVDWMAALPLSAGSLVGSMLGSKLALGPAAQQLIYRLLLVTISAELVAMAYQHWLHYVLM